MDSCDVLIVGGGPAGSACAWKLRRAGLDVLVIDKATFPRDKVCAGWITPQTIDDLGIEPADYRRRRTFQPITGFRVGIIGRDVAVETSYDHPVSYGIRRCEFDEYLLRRSGARLQLGAPITTIRRSGAHWIVNESVRTSLLVGAGGHFCPVARLLNPANRGAPLVAAQEVEFAIDPREPSSFDVAAIRPELYFCRDLAGYGWCFRKEQYLNVGFGRLGARALPGSTAAFIDFLKAQHRIPADASWQWRGHAYLLSAPHRRRAFDDGVLLVGDAAGLAYPQSGEGIRPAIESGLIAASAILDARGDYTRARLESYENRIQSRFGVAPLAGLLARAVPRRVAAAVGVRLLDNPWFVRHIVIDRWFLHAQERALGILNS